MPESNLYGYKILNKVEYRIKSRILVNIHNGRLLRLSKTKGRLLVFFLASSHEKFISDDQIISEVWEQFGLRGSYSLLAKSVKDLHMNFLSLGVDKNVFYRYTKRQFRIEAHLIEEVRLKGISTIKKEED